VSFDFDHSASSRVWLGYVGCSGLGLRARYWQFDQAGDPISFGIQDAVIEANVGSYWEDWDLRSGSLDINFGLELHAVDFEVTQGFDFCTAGAVLSGGLRYARVMQSYSAMCTHVESGVDDYQLDHVFEGYGPTVALELHRPVGCRDLALFGSFRGSVLFGDVASNVQDLEYEVPGGPLLENDDIYCYAGDNVVGILEAQIGVELTRQLPRGANLLVRLGYEGQIWDGIGSPCEPQGGPPLGFEGLILDLGLSR
jgi:hypothetical protein